MNNIEDPEIDTVVIEFL